MRVRIEIDQVALKKLVIQEINRLLGEIGFDPEKLRIETKSNQNYKSEWEDKAGFRAVYESDV